MKTKIIRIIGALALTAFMLLPVKANVVQAEEAITTVTSGDAITTVEMGKITNVEITLDGKVSWDAYPGAEYYVVESAAVAVMSKETSIYLDFMPFSPAWVYAFDEKGNKVAESGVIYNSEIGSGEGISRDKMTNSSVAYWNNEHNGVLNIKGMENTVAFTVAYYREWVDDLLGHATSHPVREIIRVQAPNPEKTYSVDLNVLLSEGVSRFSVYAIPKDVLKIEPICFATIKPPTGISTEDIILNLDGMITDNAGNTKAALLQITNTITSTDLSKAMQESAAVREKIAKLELAYQEENGITVDKNVDTYASAYIGSQGSLNALGASFSALYQNIALQVTKPVEPVVVDSSWGKAILLDISLHSEGQEIESLSIPVTVTMPVPKGIAAKDLKILHFSDDTNYELIVPAIDEVNGTVTFTVTHFSTFASVGTEEAIEEPKEEPKQDENTEEESAAEEEEQNTEDVTGQSVAEGNVKDNVPKTGDDMSVVLPVIAIFCLVFMTMILCRKRQ